MNRSSGMPLLALGLAVVFTACGGPEATPTPTPMPSSTATPLLPLPVAEVTLPTTYVLGDTVVVAVAILGPVGSEPSATLDDQSPDEVKRNTRTLEIVYIFRNVKEGEHQVHFSGGNLSHTERIAVTRGKTKVSGLRACQVLPVPTPTPVFAGVPTPTPPPVLEIELRSVEGFGGHVRAVLWFGPGGYGFLTLDGIPPDVAIRDDSSAPPSEFIFLAAGWGDHVLKAQGYPHQLEVNVRCPAP